MDSTVDAMAAAYDALVDAAAAAVREPGRPAALENLKHCLDVFKETCDRAEDLVQAAAASLGPVPPAAPRLDALCRTVQAIEQDLQAAGNKEEEGKKTKKEHDKENEKEKDPTQPAPVAVEVAGEDK